MKTKLNIFPKLFVISRLFLIILGLVCLLSSCAKVQVSQDYDSNYAFGKVNTFGWNEKLQQQNGDLLQHDELLAKRFREAIEEVLAKRGFIQDARPAFLVSYTYGITSKLQVDPVDSYFGIGYGRFGRYGGVGINTGSSIRQYDQGKLVIYIHSAMTGQLLWKGTGTREIFIHATPDQITRSVNEMVEAVLEQFPPLI
jgi:hypothetical protein